MRQAWAQSSVSDRLAIVRRVRGLVADRSSDLAAAIARPAAETLVSEVLPLAEACRFLERSAEAILSPRRVRGCRPLWLSGVDLDIRREPLGRVLVIGPANYPLFLPAVHALQALVAGNVVSLKPGVGGLPVIAVFESLLAESGLPEGVLRLLGEGPEEAAREIEAGVDKVILTGSNATGHAVMQALANHLTPSVMELSGCDAVFVRPDADLNLVAEALRFGLTLNKGQTCIAPKRVYVARPLAAELIRKLPGLPIPVTAVDDDAEAVALSERCGYALGASVFGRLPGAYKLAARIRAGAVVVNDMIVPTADPRLPFGGRGKSGFGTTRGAEGLLEMTAVKAIAVRRGAWRPHFLPRHPLDSELFAGLLSALHSGSLARRWQGVVQMSRAAMARRKVA